MVRSIDLGNLTLHIEEASELENDAGAVLWDAGIVLIYYLACSKEGKGWSDQTVIEIGAGTGAVGLASVLLGASSAVVTDLPHLLSLAEKNVALNNLTSKVTVKSLPWGTDVDHLPLPFDLLLASDVIYQQECIQPLIETLRKLCTPGACVLLSNEHRPKLPFPAAHFASAGFSIETIPIEEHHPDWRSPDIQIYRLTLASEDNI